MGSEGGGGAAGGDLGFPPRQEGEVREREGIGPERKRANWTDRG